MNDVFCPTCKKLLFKANNADVEIMCKCGRLVHIVHASATDSIFGATKDEQDYEKKLKDIKKKTDKIKEQDGDKYIKELKDTVQTLVDGI